MGQVYTDKRKTENLIQTYRAHKGFSVKIQLLVISSFSLDKGIFARYKMFGVDSLKVTWGLQHTFIQEIIKKSRKEKV